MFHDVVAFFPLLLYSLEEFFKDNKKWKLFVFSIFINCMINYFFFVGEVVFLIIYFLIRFWGVNLNFLVEKIFKCILLGCLGVGLSAFIFIPSVIYVLSNSRADNSMLNLSNIMYDSKNILFLLKGILLPGDSMRNNTAVILQKWSSTGCYLPLIGMSGIIAYFLQKKRDWIFRLLIVLLIICFSPILSSIFYLFTANYQRWWYMMTIIMVLASIIALEQFNKYQLLKSASINILLVLFFSLILFFVKYNDAEGIIVYYKDRFIIFTLIAVIGPILLIIGLRIHRLNIDYLIYLTMFSSIITTALTLHYYRIEADAVQFMTQYNVGTQLQELDPQYRYNSTSNILMSTGNANGIGAFSSTIENSSHEFDTLFDYSNPVFTTYRANINGLPELLGAKYNITTELDEGQNYIYSVDSNNEKYYITENEACPIGFSVEHYITRNELKEIPIEYRAIVLMNSIVIDSMDIGYIKDIISPFNFEYDSLDKDIRNHIKRTVNSKVSHFNKDTNGFKCKTSFNKLSVVYFSVPNDIGWSATIDGRETAIINSGGMMAIAVPAGIHDIVFTYRTPGLRIGFLISILTVFFIVIVHFVSKRGMLKR